MKEKFELANELARKEIKEMPQVYARRIEEYPNVYATGWLVDIMDEEDLDDEQEEE